MPTRPSLTELLGHKSRCLLGRGVVWQSGLAISPGGEMTLQKAYVGLEQGRDAFVVALSLDWDFKREPSDLFLSFGGAKRYLGVGKGGPATLDDEAVAKPSSDTNLFFLGNEGLGVSRGLLVRKRRPDS